MHKLKTKKTMENTQLDTMNKEILRILKKYEFLSKVSFARTIGIKNSLLNSRLQRASHRCKKHTPQLFSLLNSIEKAILMYKKQTSKRRVVRIFGNQLFLLKKVKEYKVGDQVYVSGYKKSEFIHFFCGKKGDRLPKIVEIKKGTAILDNERQDAVFFDDLYKATKYKKKKLSIVSKKNVVENK